MVSCSKIVDKEYMEELKDKSRKMKTWRMAEWWNNVFKQWANERNLQANLEEYENDVLDQQLSIFFKHPEIR